MQITCSPSPAPAPQRLEFRLGTGHIRGSQPKGEGRSKQQVSMEVQQWILRGSQTYQDSGGDPYWDWQWGPDRSAFNKAPHPQTFRQLLDLHLNNGPSLKRAIRHWRNLTVRNKNFFFLRNKNFKKQKKTRNAEEHTMLGRRETSMYIPLVVKSDSLLPT